jgi:uncharacterized membrane protein
VDYRGHTSAAPDTESNGRSFSDILKDIGKSLEDIVRSEIKLAKLEVTQSVGRLRSASVMLAGGGLLAIFALGFILVAALFALEIVLPAWLAALILGVLLLGGAAVGVSIGLRRMKTIRGPQKTIQTVKEDLQWTKEQVRS